MIPEELYDHTERLQEYCKQFWVSEENMKDTDLLLLPFIHKTYAADYRKSLLVPYNERLEFLWDSILGSCVAQMLFEQFPEHPESQLTLSKIYLVKEGTLAEIARKIDLGSYMFLWTGEQRSWWRDKDSVLSDWLEALIAYIFIVSWNDVVKAFIKKYVMCMLDEKPLPTKSFKSKIQELCQQRHKELPEYEIEEVEVEQSGNVLLYEARVSVQWVVQWIGHGPSKKKAQEAAAEKAYNALQEQK